MDNDYIESVWWALRRIWDDGRLYEGHKVVPYCPRCGTALSSHEVAQGYHDVEDPSVYLKLPIGEPTPNDEIPESPLQAGDQLLVWTTTPWTLITNAAVAAGPDIEYVRARHGDEVFVLARERVEAVLGEEAEVLAHFPGEALAGHLATSRPSPTSPTTGPRATRSCSATSSAPTREPAWSTPRSPSARTTSGWASSTGSRCRTRSSSTAPSTSASPTSPAAPSRRPTPTSSRPWRRRASCCAPRPTCTAIRTAGAATRRSSTTRSRAGTSRRARSRTGCSPRTRRSAGTPITSSTAASGSGWRTTSTGRSAATATGEPRCRSGSASQPDCERAASAPARSRT